MLGQTDIFLTFAKLKFSVALQDSGDIIQIMEIVQMNALAVETVQKPVGFLRGDVSRDVQMVSRVHLVNLI